MKKKTTNNTKNNDNSEVVKLDSNNVIVQKVETLDPITHKKRVFVINFAFYLCILILVYLFGKYLLPILVPFIIGFIMAFIVRSISISIFKKPGKKRQLVILAVLYIVLVFLFATGFVLVVNSLATIDYGSVYSGYLEPAINIIYKEVIEFNHSLPASFATLFDQVTASIFDAVKAALLTVSTYLINLIKGIVISVPSSLVSITVIVVSSIYFALDYEKIVNFLLGLLPKKPRKVVDDLVYFIGHNIFAILKSYIAIIFITFVELLIAFTILKIKNKGIIALLIALMDILPIVGVGTALIPWLVVELVFGHFGLSLGLLVTYLIITVIRNIIEPRLVGETLGLDPLLSLVCMIVGLGLFGLAGMMGTPLLAAFIIFEKKRK